MMKTFFALLAFIGLCAPVHAAPTISGALTASGVYQPGYPPSAPLPVPPLAPVSGLITFSGTIGGIINITNAPGPFLGSCGAIPTVSSSGFTISCGYFTLSVNFDQDLGGNLANAGFAQVTGGSFYENLSGSGLLSYVQGTVTGGTVTVQGYTPAVPEPASWALMIGGFALVGAGLRHRRNGRLGAADRGISYSA